MLKLECVASVDGSVVDIGFHDHRLRNNNGVPDVVTVIVTGHGVVVETIGVGVEIVVETMADTAAYY